MGVIELKIEKEWKTFKSAVLKKPSLEMKFKMNYAIFNYKN